MFNDVEHRLQINPHLTQLLPSRMIELNQSHDSICRKVPSCKNKHQFLHDKPKDPPRQTHRFELYCRQALVGIDSQRQPVSLKVVPHQCEGCEDVIAWNIWPGVCFQSHLDVETVTGDLSSVFQ
jgi:hypothetical protein